MPAQACVDYHPPTIWVSTEYDSTFTECIITVHNLELFGSPAGTFCSCGISNSTNLFTTILYVAFLDSGTTNPVAGFDPWTPSNSADASWNNIQTGNWDGFIAQAVGAGLITGTPVELVIRAQLPPGYILSILDSNIYSTYVGTDEWDATGDSLAKSHNSISSFWTIGPVAYTEQPISYFTNFDNAVQTGLKELYRPTKVNMYPNPTTGKFTITLPAVAKAQLLIYDMLGQIVLRKTLNTKQEILNLSSHPKGIYFVKVISGGEVFVEKIIYK